MANIKREALSVKRKVIKFKDAPKKTRKKRKPIDKAKPVGVKGSTLAKVEPSKKEPEKAPKVESKKAEKNRRNGFATHFETFRNNLIALPMPKQLLLLPAPKKYKEKSVQKGFFPKIYRFITETWFQVAVLSVVLLISLGLMFQELHKHMQQQHALEQKRAAIQRQITYWQGVIRKYQDYRDGYFKLALLEYQLGNIQAAELYIQKTKTLDPNFTEADKLEGILSK